MGLFGSDRRKVSKRQKLRKKLSQIKRIEAKKKLDREYEQAEAKLRKLKGY